LVNSRCIRDGVFIGFCDGFPSLNEWNPNLGSGI
jgi:hypothetical protein